VSIQQALEELRRQLAHRKGWHGPRSI
jgi:hypothetical protein